MTLLLTMTLFMWLLAEKIPAASDSMSRLGIFFNVFTVMMVVMVFGMVFVAVMHHKKIGDEPLPTWLRTFVFNWLAFKVGIRSRESKKDETKRKSHFIRCSDSNSPSNRNLDHSSISVSIKEGISPNCKKVAEEKERDDSKPATQENNNIPKDDKITTIEKNRTEENRGEENEEVNKHCNNAHENRDAQSAEGNKNASRTFEEKDVTGKFNINGQNEENIELQMVTPKEDYAHSNNCGEVASSLTSKQKECEATKEKNIAPTKSLPRLRNIGLHLMAKKRGDTITNEKMNNESSSDVQLPTKLNKMSFKRVADCAMKNLAKQKYELTIQKLEKERKEKRFFYEWRVCAETVDRTFSILSVLVFLVTVVCIFNG